MAPALVCLLLVGCQPPESDFPQPQNVVSQAGALETDLYVQFAKASVPGATNGQGQPLDTIWVRGYSTEQADTANPLDELPGPTLVFRPGDWLQIDLKNQLNQEANSWLRSMDTHIPPGNEDDVVGHVPQELNIPHNANNTNLHVHGMHVDPTADNVTLLILPEDDDPSQYSPELQRLIPDINRWWEWSYRYRIPQDHLPGTHWYHAHKHGATSTHVENGMAGTLVVRPNDDSNALVPGLWNDDPTRTDDRVLMLQEIANFGIQQGQGRGVGLSTTQGRPGSNQDALTTNWPEITINGEHQPVLEMAPGELERWRFIDAGANHRSASYIWVGGLELPQPMDPVLRAGLERIQGFDSIARAYTKAAPPGCAAVPGLLEVTIMPFPGQVNLVAVDGVTMSAARPVTPDGPFLVGPGNRSDVLVQLDAGASGDYYVSKNFRVVPPIEAMQAAYPGLFEGEAGFWRYQSLIAPGCSKPVQNVFDGDDLLQFDNLSLDPYALGTNFTGDLKPWPRAVDASGRIASGSAPTPTPVVPLLYGRETDIGVDVTTIPSDLSSFSGLGWAPVAPGPPSLVDSQVLMTIRVMGDPVTDGPAMPTDERLNRLSPNGDPDNTLLQTSVDGRLEQGIPAYVSPIPDSAVSGRQVIVFDRSGVKFFYGPDSAQTAINQFSLNGRQFDLQDFVGNPRASYLMQEPVPDTIRIPTRAEALGAFSYTAGARDYSNQVQVEGDEVAFVTNPGYYRAVVDSGSYYTYDYAGNDPASRDMPTYELVTGLESPEQPVARTAEEWILVNNSRVFHPFHIHISPFFLTEVGQLDYDTVAGEWGMSTLQPDDDLGYMLNNWWDVVIIPPQGYVKFRTWMNIPDQKPSNPADPESRFEVLDNQNVFGSWVYHCHILRHEDRGMMMVVNVRPSAEARREEEP